PGRPSRPVVRAWRIDAPEGFLDRFLPLQEQVHERRVGTDVPPLLADAGERLIAADAVALHQIGGDDHPATADSGGAADVDRPASAALIGDEIDLLSQPVETGGRTKVVNRFPAMDLRIVGVLLLAEVEDGTRPGRRLAEVATHA